MQMTEQFVFWSTLPRHYLFKVQILNDNVYFDMKKASNMHKINKKAFISNKAKFLHIF